jgi:hypothetical protein
MGAPSDLVPDFILKTPHIPLPKKLIHLTLRKNHLD